MRTLVLPLCVLTTAFALAQTAPQTAAPAPHPQKALTPQQEAYKKAIDDFGEQSVKLQAAALAAYNAELAREKAPRCPGANNTRAINECLSHENELTRANYKAFVQAVRALIALSAPEIPDMSGPTGPSRTSATETAAFDKAEAAWQAYASAECSEVVDTHWRGGTIVDAMDLECGLRLARARMHELNDVYSITHPM